MGPAATEREYLPSASVSALLAPAATCAPAMGSPLSTSLTTPATEPLGSPFPPLQAARAVRVIARRARRRWMVVITNPDRNGAGSRGPGTDAARRRVQ